MTPQVLLFVVALSGIHYVTSDEAFKCPQICHCTASKFQCISLCIHSPPLCLFLIFFFLLNCHFWHIRLVLKHLDLEELPTHAFKELINIKAIINLIHMYFFCLSPSVSSSCSTIKNLKNLRTIEKGAFTDLPNLNYLSLIGSGFKEIYPHAFNGTFIRTLDVSSTALTSLPRKGLEQVKRLKAKSAFALKRLPPLDSLAELGVAELTYASQCCAFHLWYSKHRQEALKNPSPFCESIYTNFGRGTDLYNNHPQLEHICPSHAGIQCTPESDPFNPCEDLLGPILGNVTWIIAFFTIVANLTVLVILLFTSRKLTISRFLICNLALADLCMGFYLMLIARMDYHSRHEYYNHATEWQTGPGCDMSGFLTMFSSELSVYTLTVISFERWYTIINAMDLNKRLGMHHVLAIMVAGWVFSLVVALLPLVGVSSYSKVSVCLPMDIDTRVSQAYVLIVLSLNVVAFLGVCFCYVCIYQSVRKPAPANHHDDAKLAKRMAVLIFTDFLCMAPISFFAISATLHMPLITMSHSKFILIIFYPINSLCNPFLYTIFTRGFRKEVRLLLQRCRSMFIAFQAKGPRLPTYLHPNNAQRETTL
uniref:Luteinizing hormone/choriogonadotropin receptor n=1 Tax=Hippocampus comes TaxID=109280 RepID=A0A3Q2XZ51_HIPCM